jgi:hypothetical protein
MVRLILMAVSLLVHRVIAGIAPGAVYQHARRRSTFNGA